MQDIVGFKIGMVTVLRLEKTIPSGTKKSNHYYAVKCECGNEAIKGRWSLIIKKPKYTINCGCMMRKNQSLSKIDSGKSIKGKIKSNFPEYQAWISMKERCFNTNNKFYVSYGGRGVSISKNWFSFNEFYADMGDRPTKHHSLDRIDNNGNYEKSNCRWATKTEQANNRRNNVFILHNGETKTIDQWYKTLGISTISRSLFYYRVIKKKMPIADIIKELNAY